MKIVWFILILIYYGICAIIFAGMLSSPYSTDNGYTSDFNLSQVDTGDVNPFDWGRFGSLLFFGIGLPDDTPSWVTLIFGIWQTCITIVMVLLILSLTPLIPS